MATIGHGVEHDARIGADLHLAGLGGRQIDVHIDIADVEHREDPAAGRQHLADIGDAVLDASVARRDERVVGDVDLVEFDVVRRRRRCARSASPTRSLRGAERGGGAVERLPALVEKFVGREAARDERAGAVELLLRERDLASSAARRWRAPRREPACACCTCACDLLSEASRSRVSMRARTCPAFTMSPSSASISAMRPANLVSMSISSASIRPLPRRCRAAARPDARATNRPRLPRRSRPAPASRRSSRGYAGGAAPQTAQP